MKLRKLAIKNFRGIVCVELDLDDTVVLIGENNSGKTAVLDVLRLCLRELGQGRRVVFDPFDFHLKDAAADPASADPITLTLTFSEDSAGEWAGPVVGKLNRAKVLQVGDDDRNHVILRVVCDHDPLTGDPLQRWNFLNLAGANLTGIGESSLTILQQEVSCFYLPALRDAARHFDAKGPYWRPFLKESQLPAAMKAQIEEKLREVNELVVASHSTFEQARRGLRRVQDVVPMASGDAVSIEAVPGRLFDMLAKAQVYLGTVTGAKLPVSRHGEGTQSLAVLMLFSAFLDAWPKGAPIVCLEEPEAHLHPSAVRSLWSILVGIAGQKILSSHSGDLLSEVPIRAVRRLVKGSSGIEIHRLAPTTLGADDERKFDFHVRQGRGELLFARCWLLVEGETEMTLLPEIARHLDINLERSGVRCVAHRNAGIELFLKVAKDLGIGWCVLADNDSQGLADQRRVREYSPPGRSDVLHVLPQANIEEYLCAEGFGHVYEALLTDQTRKNIVVPAGHDEYWTQVVGVQKKSINKPSAALEVLKMVRAGQKPIPELLQTTIRAAVSLAGGA